jgi:hypothetical protein
MSVAARASWASCDRPFTERLVWAVWFPMRRFSALGHLGIGITPLADEQHQHDDKAFELNQHAAVGQPVVCTLGHNRQVADQGVVGVLARIRVRLGLEPQASDRRSQATSPARKGRASPKTRTTDANRCCACRVPPGLSGGRTSRPFRQLTLRFKYLEGEHA